MTLPEGGFTRECGNNSPAPGQYIDQLFVNGNIQTIARYPNLNVGYLNTTSSTGNNNFYSSQLTQPTGYFNGANVRIRTYSWQWQTVWRTKLSNHSYFQFYSLYDFRGKKRELSRVMPTDKSILPISYRMMGKETLCFHNGAFTLTTSTLSWTRKESGSTTILQDLLICTAQVTLQVH